MGEGHRSGICVVARFTTAYSEFVVRSQEVLILVRRAASLERSKEVISKGTEIDALCRGAIVLLSSHIEAYVKELGECALDAIYDRNICRSRLNERFFYYISKDWLNRVQDATEPDDVSLKVFEFLAGESEFWGRTGPLPRPIDSQEFCKGFSNPKFDKIRKFLNRFGYDGLRHHINVSLKADAVITLSNVDQIVDTRNAIAHGELSATKTPREVQILVTSAKQFCRTVDDGFASWFKANICPIR